MEYNTNLDELLISYLLNESNAEQEALILKWIDSDDANRRYFDELKRTVRLVGVGQANGKIDVHQEWIAFKEAVGGISDVEAVALENEAGESSFGDPGDHKRKPAIYRIFASVAVAASILLVIGFGWKMFADTKSVEVATALEVEKTPGNVQHVIRREVNTSNKPKSLVLPDGSEVVLASKSEVTFSDPFPVRKRDIGVKGKASFNVSKDTSKPFTVFSGDISTTALGTSFTVTAYENADQIFIRLYEGKVVVKSGDNAKAKLKNSYYLLPGQELIYNNKRSVARVRGFKVGTATKILSENKEAEKTVLDNPSIPLHNLESWYMFNNQALNEVFEQLRSLYDADIVYNKKDVQKLYFIGTFNKSDSVENILKHITALNNLKVVKKNKQYIISKK